MRTPKGFSYAAAHAKIKAARNDMALVYSDLPCSAAGCFTVNRAAAAPVVDAAKRLPKDGVRAVVANSGNANALTGPEGAADVLAVHEALGRALGVDAGAVLSASTGVIGVRLPIGKLVAACPALAAARSASIEKAAEAILTTDTRVKLTHRIVVIGGVDVCIAAFCKGAGMIAPEMATMLAFMTTDAAVAPKLLQEILQRAVAQSFNNLTVDGDMSTNDAVFLLANGASGARAIERADDVAAFEAALTSICVELARAIAEDGEGATKLVEVKMNGAPTLDVARDLARAVAGSNLVKAAIFGADPNWGRILASVGARVGTRNYAVDPTRASVDVQGVRVYADGRPQAHDAAALRARMREPNVAVAVTLAEGTCDAIAWGCDLSYDYVKINADYTSLTSASPEGVVSKDDRLTNYTPSFKRSLLVEALSYISRFTEKRAVIKYGGAAMIKDALKASFANDVNLLRSAGLLPIVVHGGGPEISKTLEKLGHKKSEFIDGVRVTDESEVKIVEMVLTGKINTELVSMLNNTGRPGDARTAHALGLSGKDAGLLRARRARGKDGRDLGMVGEITSVNRELLEMFLGKRYVPMISPVALGDEGEGYNVNADTVAAEIAVAVDAEKLIYLTDVPGFLEQGELVTEISADALRKKLDAGEIGGGMAVKVAAALRAIDGGVRSVHLIDGRTPHGIVAELFTDRGIGTLIRNE